MTPAWRLLVKASRTLGKLRLLRMRACGVRLGRDVQVWGPVDIWRGQGRGIAIGDRAVLSSASWANPISSGVPTKLALMAPDARIEIGEDTGITSSVVAARDSVSIGRRVLIGAGCMIFDNDFHQVAPQGRRHAKADAVACSPVVIGDDVWLGANVTVMKGVRIGDGVAVAANSTVTKSLEANGLYAGNPAKFIRMLA